MRKRNWFLVAGAIVLLAGASLAQMRAPRTMKIYVVDVEGGNSTLFVGPTGESVLIDAENPDLRGTPNASWRR